MAKDSKGHGSERRATGAFMGNGGKEHATIAPSKAAVAVGRGWKDAVSFKAPGRVAKVYENMAKAKSAAEKHPGFLGWKK